MAGMFPGQPLGSFSGRGADFQPFQFAQQMRQRAIEQEQARKQQAAAQQQSFVMALMAKKQQEAELAQQAQQFQASQQARAAEKQMAAEQFRAEQQRLRDAEQAQLELRKLGEQRAATEKQRAQEEQRGLVAKAENRRALGLNVHAATVRGLEQRFQQFSAIPGSDPIQALDAIEAQALEETKQIDDPEAQALAVEEIRAWRADKESQLGRRESLGSMIEARKNTAADRAEGRRLQSERDRANKIAKANKPIEDEIERLERDKRIAARAAAAFKGEPEGKNLEDEVARLDGEIAKLRAKLQPLE